jgi:hypothetical protein
MDVARGYAKVIAGDFEPHEAVYNLLDDLMRDGPPHPLPVLRLRELGLVEGDPHPVLVDCWQKPGCGRGDVGDGEANSIAICWSSR